MTKQQDVLARLRQAIEFAQNSPEPKVWGPGDVTYSPRLTIEGDLFDAVAALVRTPETLNPGTTTDCPLEGVHEHAFRGPHRFHEWDPSSYFTLNDRPPVRTPETLDVEHAAHLGNHRGFACDFSAPHCWGCGEPWPCRSSRGFRAALAPSAEPPETEA